MLDVMVLSVLALTARQQAGEGSTVNIPLPASGLSRMVQEGLRKEADYQDKIALLQEQLNASNDLAKDALEQAKLAEEEAERERSESDEALAKMRAAELAAERAKAEAQLAQREAELVNEQAQLAEARAKEMQQKEAEARERTRELELREIQAKSRADAALERVQLAEAKAVEAERMAKEAEQNAGAKDAEVMALQQQVQLAKSEQEQAEKQAAALTATLVVRENELLSARSAEAAAKAEAKVADAERERLTVKNEQMVSELTQAKETAAVMEVQHKDAIEKVAAIEEQKQDVEQKVAVLEEEKKAAVAELSKSVWVQRDEALRRVIVSFSEYNTSHGQSYPTSVNLALPLVKMEPFIFVPAEFKTLGLKKNFFGGLSDRITNVRGVVGPMVLEDVKLNKLNAILVPSAEPQVCLVHPSGELNGALEPVTMQGLKEQKMRTALLFSPYDANDFGEVKIYPVIGRDYLKIEPSSGKKPRVGDYLLSDRGQFIGVMIEPDVCSVLAAQLPDAPKPVVIPLTKGASKGFYWTQFTANLNKARSIVDQHMETRKF